LTRTPRVRQPIGSTWAEHRVHSQRAPTLRRPQAVGLDLRLAVGRSDRKGLQPCSRRQCRRFAGPHDQASGSGSRWSAKPIRALASSGVIEVLVMSAGVADRVSSLAPGAAQRNISGGCRVGSVTLGHRPLPMKRGSQGVCHSRGAIRYWCPRRSGATKRRQRIARAAVSTTTRSAPRPALCGGPGAEGRDQGAPLRATLATPTNEPFRGRPRTSSGTRPTRSPRRAGASGS
jgi:hypothetical protein